MEQYLSVLSKCAFFAGLSDEEILSALHCVRAAVIKKSAGEYILRAGETTSSMGIVLSGSVLIAQEDLWGHRNVMTKSGAGDFFAEPYAATPGTVLNISVIAEQDCAILLVQTRHLLTVCPSACEFHNKIIRNLVSVLAGKLLMFHDKITHMSKRTTREKLLSYLTSESIRCHSLSFDIPFDRQQLADYLGVERAAMSVELSKLQRDGLLETKKNHFTLLMTPEELA